MDSRAVWLLDVDGVLNAHRPGWGQPPSSGFARAMGGSFRITWASAMVQRLRQIHDGGTVEVRWATTWVSWIGEIEALLGLPSWPPAFQRSTGPPSFGAPSLKLGAALAVVEHEGRPLVWTDDDAIPTGGEALHRLTVGRAPALLIRPDPAQGLQPEDLDAVEAFLADPRP